MPIREEERTVQYIHDAGDGSKKVMGRTNPETWQFMKERYVVLRNFIPKDIINMCLDTWKTTEGNPDWEDTIMYREVDDITHMTPEHQKNKSKGGYCTPWGVALHRWIHDALDNKIDLDLGETYSYSRRYERGAYLTSHTDRPSCEVSATLCLDYQSDDGSPWKIWLQNDQDYIDFHNNKQLVEETQGIPPRRREKAKCISLEVGDLLLYQGPNIPHWRDTFVGEYSYHIFVHFFNRQSNMLNLPWGQQEDRQGMVGAVPPNSVLEFDGRKDRYSVIDSTTEHRQNFEKFGKFWDRDIFREVPNVDRSLFCNNYTHLTKLEPRKNREENDSI